MTGVIFIGFLMLISVGIILWAVGIGQRMHK